MESSDGDVKLAAVLGSADHWELDADPLERLTAKQI